MAKSDKGLTLIEVLAAVATLAVVILAITYLFSNSQVDSSKNTETTQSVNIARTVMEHIKHHLQPVNGLSSTEPIVLYGQEVDLAALREEPAVELVPFFYPSQSEQRYEIAIRTEAFSAPIDVQEQTLNLNRFFRLVTISIYDKTLPERPLVYELQHYAEFNE